MATLNPSIQASDICQRIQTNTYCASEVIDTSQASCLSCLNILTIDNPGTTGNCITSIQANCFVPIMYNPTSDSNRGYSYYGTSFRQALESNSIDTYTLATCNNLQAAWVGSNGVKCYYTQVVPSSGSSTNIYNSTNMVAANCIGTLSGACVCHGYSVACNYNDNLKINEANIPYLNAKLIKHGELPTQVIPKTHGDLSSNTSNDVPVTKGDILDSIQGMARAAYYNNGILSLWGYGSDGCMYITDAISLGASTDISQVTEADFGTTYPIVL